MKKVLDFVQRFDLLPRYELLLAAASGGLDSMCLLDFLYENGYRVCAAHYNHQLRGQEADMDEDLVRAWCAARRIPLCVGTGDVAAYAGENGLTIEEAARKLRYDFLNSVAGQTGAARIVTAHHANDNAETVLFHYDALAALCAGSGTAQLDLPGGVTARRTDGVLTLCAHRRETPERVLLRAGETVRWGGFAITCRKCEKTVENSENTVILRGAALDAPLSVGAWDARESMTLPVSRGSRSLKRLFAERGFSPDEREQTPVIRSGGAVAAVYGIGTDALFLPGDGESVCVLTFEKTAE